MRSQERSGARRYWAALIFLLLGSLAGAWHNRQAERGQADLLSASVRSVVAPPSNAVGKVSRWFSEKTGWIFHGAAVAAENRELKARVESLEKENIALREYQVKYDSLRGDLGFVQNRASLLLPADVIARRPDPKFDTLMIARGARDGVKPNDVVVTRNGLVGRVFEVTGSTASVLMLTDQNSGVGARVQRAASRATGVCKGDNSSRLSMVYLPNDADIKVGDIIVTSGLRSVYARGLPVGVVRHVRADAGNTLKTAIIEPYVDFDRLEEVYVQR